ncbi:MAG: carboxypeptidase regulatory-like domain-containing protein [Anaerolineae bacterium]
MNNSNPTRRRRLIAAAIVGGVAALALLALLYLLPVPVRGQVSDVESGQPLANAVVTLSTGEQVRTDAAGTFAARASRFRPFSAAVDHGAFLPWQGDASFGVLPLAPASLAVTLQPTLLQGQVINAIDGQPVAGATISGGDQSAISDAEGRFELRRLPRAGAQVALAADGFIAYELPLSDWDAAGAEPTTLAIYPNGLHGHVSDAQNGQPLAGVALSLNGQSSASLDNGFFFFPSETGAGEISAQQPGFLPAAVAVDSPEMLAGQEAVEIALQPTLLAGVVSDYQTGQPLAGVALSAGDQSATSDAEGRYLLERLHGGDLTLAAELEGFEPASQPIDEAANLLGGAPLDVTMMAPHLAGRLVNNVTNNPIVGATITAGDLTATSDDDGRFILWTTDLPLAIAVEAPGYEAAQAEFSQDVELAVALEPKGLVVTVTDNAGQPVSGAVVASQRSEATTDSQGIALLPLIEAGDTFTVTASHFAPVAQTFDGATQAALALAPDTVIGQAVDAQTGESIPGVVVYAYDRDVCQGIACRGTTPVVYGDAAEDGSFQLSGLPANPQLMLKAPGYSLYFPEALEGGDCDAPLCLTASMEPFEARGFYVPFHYSVRPCSDRIAAGPDRAVARLERRGDRYQERLRRAGLGSTEPHRPGDRRFSRQHHDRAGVFGGGSATRHLHHCPFCDLQGRRAGRGQTRVGAAPAFQPRRHLERWRGSGLGRSLSAGSAPIRDRSGQGTVGAGLRRDPVRLFPFFGSARPQHADLLGGEHAGEPPRGHHQLLARSAGRAEALWHLHGDRCVWQHHPERQRALHRPESGRHGPRAWTI